MFDLFRGSDAFVYQKFLLLLIPFALHVGLAFSHLAYKAEIELRLREYEALGLNPRLVEVDTHVFLKAIKVQDKIFWAQLIFAFAFCGPIYLINTMSEEHKGIFSWFKNLKPYKLSPKTVHCYSNQNVV